MSDLAIALQGAGHVITGSDEEIAGLAKSKLLNDNLLPNHAGWSTETLRERPDTVIIGANIKRDNPELQQAQKLNLVVCSFPDFIYQQSIDKQRLVIAGTYSKTLIAGLIIHILNFHKRKFDYAIDVLLYVPAITRRCLSMDCW